MDASNYRIIGRLEITPNAYSDPTLVSVVVAPDAYIEVYSPKDGILRDKAWSFRRWALSGRNTKLSGVTGYGYIYARVMIELNEGEIIFSKHDYNPNGTAKDDASIPASSRYYYVKIGNVLAATPGGVRSLGFSKGSLSNNPEQVEMEVRFDELDNTVGIIDGKLEEQNSMDWMTASDKRQKAADSAFYTKEGENLILKAMRYGVDEDIIMNFTAAFKALTKMLDYISTYEGSMVPLKESSPFLGTRRLGIKYSKVEEVIGIVKYHQYDIAYVLPEDRSLQGWCDTTQVYLEYSGWKERVNDEIEQIITAESAMSLSAAPISLNSDAPEISLAVGERDGKKYIQILGKDGTVISELDAALLV